MQSGQTANRFQRVEVTNDGQVVNTMDDYAETDAGPAGVNPAVVDGLRSSGSEKFKLGEQVNAGGMGVILSANDANLRRRVAIKVMKDADRATDVQVMRFIHEAQITGQLEHPGIVPVYELGVDPKNRPFYTMRMLEGRTLHEILEGIRQGDATLCEAWPLSRLITLFVQICQAIRYAHGKHVIHRDLKPENIIAGEFGEVQVLDWGLAMILPAPAASADKEGAAAMRELFDGLPPGTGGRAAGPAGTPSYMAPEQAAADELDKRTDVYGLGALLYEIITLHPPIEGSSSANILELAMRGEIKPPAEHPAGPHLPGPRIPSALSAIATKAMALHPVHRYQNVADLLQDVNAYQDGFATGAEEASATRQVMLFLRRHKLAALLTTCLGLSILAASALSIVQRNQALDALAGKEAAEKNRIEEARISAPAFLESAKTLVALNDLDAAGVNVRQAVENDPSLEGAHRLHAYLLAAGQDVPSALSAVAVLAVNDPLRDVVEELGDGDESAWARLGHLAQADGYPGLAASFLAKTGQQVEFTPEFMAGWSNTLDRVSPGLSSSFLYNGNIGGLDLNLLSSNLSDLNGLRGLPLTRLNTGHYKGLLDLEPLRGMPLRQFYSTAEIRDLDPIASSYLKVLEVSQNKLASQCDWSGLAADGVRLDVFTPPELILPHAGAKPPSYKWLSDIGSRRILLRYPMAHFDWLGDVEGLEYVDIFNVDGIGGHSFRSLMRVPTLKRIMVHGHPRISGKTIGIGLEVPSVDIPELEALMATRHPGNENCEVVNWWMHHFELMHYLLKKRGGQDAELPDSPWITTMVNPHTGTNHVALVHLSMTKSEYLHYFGTAIESIHTPEQERQALELLHRLSLPGLTPSLKLGAEQNGDDWVWRNGAPFDYDRIRAGDGRGHSLYLAKEWTSNRSGSAFHLISWPVDGPKEQPVQEWVRGHYPNHLRLDWGRHRYAIIEEPVTFQTACEVAKAYGATLYKQEAADETSAIYQYIKKYTLSEDHGYWCGNKGNDDGRPLAMVKRVFQETPASVLLPFVLEWENPSDCPEPDLRQWGGGKLWDNHSVFFGDSQYVLARRPLKTWGSAKVVAEAIGGHLATVNSEEELAFLMKAYVRVKREIWLGGTDMEAEGDWRWVTGEPFDLDEKLWAPDNFAYTEHCMGLIPGVGLNDAPSGRYQPFLIERKISEKPKKTD